ncbi:MAG: Ig-like domain-containing protein, partial [Clostridia bacterium]|nr:Ig-like domain-containing protein [Clostridia bacterium]
MEKVKISKKVLAIVLVVMMLLSSFPLSMVLSAQTVTEQCPICLGSGFVACHDCENGKVQATCSDCEGKGTKTVSETCDVCTGSGNVTIDCTDCGGTGEKDGSPCPTCLGNKVIETQCTACEGSGQKTHDETCQTCSGNGNVEIDCTVCNGSGKIECSNCNGTGYVENEYETCPECHGNKTVEQDCSVCHGNKEVDTSCSDCEGKGTKTVSEACDVCSGSGNVTIDCTDCGGTGEKDGSPCPTCLGNKTIETQCTACEGSGQKTHDETCQTCSGTGKTKIPCTNCAGTGKEEVTCDFCNGEGRVQTTHDDSFAFADATPSAIGVGETLSNQASSQNNTTGEVTYTSSDSETVSVDASGVITAHKVGSATITARIETDYHYSSEEISYDITVEKGTPVIGDGDYTVEPISYQQTLEDSSFTSVSGHAGEKTVPGTAEWKDTSIAPEVDDSQSTEYTAVFTPEDEVNYKSVEFSAKLTVNPIDITGINVTGTTVNYDAKAHDAVTVTGTVAGDTTEYSTDDETYTDQMPTIKEVDDNTNVYVKVTRNNNYNVFKTCVGAAVNPANVGSVKFDTYNEDYDSKPHAAVQVSTTIDGGKDPVDHYEYNGESYDSCPQFVHAGTYPVIVVLDKNYASGDARRVEVTSVISRKDVTIETAARTVTYNAKPYTTIAENATVSLCEDDRLTSIQPDGEATEAGEHFVNVKDAVILRGDENVDVTDDYNITYQQAKLTIEKRPATLSVKNVDATYTAKNHPAQGYDYETDQDRYTISGLVEDPAHTEKVSFFGENKEVGNYEDLLDASCQIFEGENEVTKNYEITIQKGDLSITYPVYDNSTYQYINADEDEGEGEWYQLPLTIQAKEGYTLCYENTDPNAFNNSDKLTYEQNGITKPSFAVKEEATGYISAVLEREEVKIDQVNPTTFNLEYSTALAYRVLEIITFGFYDAPAEVTLRAQDEHSNIASITYQIGEDEAVTVPVESLTPDTDGSYYYEISVPKTVADFEGQITYSATDNSGRSSTQEDDFRGVIVDTKNPVFTQIEYVDSVRTVDKKHYYAGDATAKFTVDEEYFFRNYYKSLEDLKNDPDNTKVKDALKEDVVLKIEKNTKPVDVTEDYKPYYEGSALPAEATNLFSAQWDEDAKTISITIPEKL